MNTHGFILREAIFLGAFLSAGTMLLLAHTATLPAGRQLAVCMNNVKNIGEALFQDAAEHNGKLIWQERRNPNYQRASPNVWENFILLSNYLATPSVFACPSDARRPALTFSEAPGGLASPEFQNNGISYFFGSDSRLYTELDIFLGERHLLGGDSVICSSITPPYRATSFDQTLGRAGILRWGPQLHGGEWGMLARPDGNVIQATKSTANNFFATSEVDLNFGNHALLPY